MITSDTIVRRAFAVPQRSDPYSQSTIDPDDANAGYRPDCSGWVSYCWACPKSGPGTWGGYSTATFITTEWAPGVPGIMYEIPRSELQSGDAIGHCGPTTGGNGGHIALWLGKAANGQERIIDHGGGWGPVERLVTWGVSGTAWNSAGKIKAFRFRGVESDANQSDGVMDMFSKHGDGGPVVEAMQLLGLAAGGALPKWGPDADYGDETAAMLVALGLPGDGRTYGPEQYAALMVKIGDRGGAPAPAPDLTALNDRVSKVETAVGKLVPHTHSVSVTVPTGAARPA